MKEKIENIELLTGRNYTEHSASIKEDKYGYNVYLESHPNTRVFIPSHAVSQVVYKQLKDEA